MFNTIILFYKSLTIAYMINDTHTHKKNNSTSRFLFVWDLTIIQHSFNMREKQRMVVVVVYIKPPETYNWHAPQWWYVGKGLSWLSLQLSGFDCPCFPCRDASLFVPTSTNLCLCSSHGHHLGANLPSPYFTATHPKPRRITQRLWRILTSPVSPGPKKKLDIKTLIVDRTWTSPAKKG